MTTVGIRQLKEQASELLRLVREEGREIRITYHGRVAARIVPVHTPDEAESQAAWAALDELAAEIGQNWPAGVSAAQAVSEGRR